MPIDLTKILYGVLLSTFNLMVPYAALVTVPVADLMGEPIIALQKPWLPAFGYDTLPHSSGINGRAACPRMHQLLFNEVVDVLETKNDEVKVEISSAFFIPHNRQQPQITYWMQARAITPTSHIKLHKHCLIPPTITFHQPSSMHNKSIIVLIAPWYDAKTGMTFSAGTRFVRIERPQRKKTISVWRFNPSTKVCEPVEIPSTHCTLSSDTSIAHCVQHFIVLLRSWAQQHDGIIPYVLGGTSLTRRLCDEPIVPEVSPTDSSVQWYARKNDRHTPKCGLDCSGLILRAAQIAGIPYFCKNTTTMMKVLQPLGPTTPIKNGDLICIPGHVLIAVDIGNNMIVEARSYEHGYGKVHELPLNKVFKDVTTFQDLMQIYRTRQPIERIDIQGNVRDRFPSVTILSLASAWLPYLSEGNGNEEIIRSATPTMAHATPPIP